MKARPLINPTSLFSAPDRQPSCAAAASPPPTTTPFQAPDFGEDETFPYEDVPAPASGRRPARPEAA
ncbi:hypothetical protein [Streptomyces sp. NPDC006012]|uniref:hypothetical protein n=1 Tax=Streptomyces sp. NPDC006012 TaxID=3364739 RepID=UPI0036A94BF9